MIHRFSSVSGFVLAGGASRRMGRDKAKLVLAGKSMLERQVRLLQAVCRSVAVVGPPEVHPGLEIPIFPDTVPGCGPLGGIYSGLLRTRTEYNLFLGCDLPFMEERFLHWLAGKALQHHADATVPTTREGQPLCAVYRRRAVRGIRATLASGRNELRGFFPRVHRRVIPWPEIAREGFSPRIFANMNTREDYDRAKVILGR
jgi:molybdopterin-guanine dinucleotide biosynthesis protein A